MKADITNKQANKLSYFWIKHIGDSIHGAVQQKASDEENEEHHVGEDGGEVHDLECRRGGTIKLDFPVYRHKQKTLPWLFFYATTVVVTEAKRINSPWQRT